MGIRTLDWLDNRRPDNIPSHRDAGAPGALQ